MIDIHHHLLYGMDDGPTRLAEMEAMLAAAVREGIRAIIATPHIAPGLTPFAMDRLYLRVAEAQALSDAAGYDLVIWAGSEMLYTYQAERYLAQQRVPTLAGSNRLLMEFSPSIRYAEAAEAVRAVLRCGYQPVLAHIERYPCLMSGRNAHRLKAGYDVLYQVNADFLLSGQGFFAKRAVRRLLMDGEIAYVASDAHDVDKRACRLGQAYGWLKALVGESGADALTGNRFSAEEFLGE